MNDGNVGDGWKMRLVNVLFCFVLFCNLCGDVEYQPEYQTGYQPEGTPRRRIEERLIQSESGSGILFPWNVAELSYHGLIWVRN